jgi:hypothetical protein
MQAKHKNTGRWEGTKPCLSDFQVHLTAKKCGPVSPLSQWPVACALSKGKEGVEKKEQSGRGGKRTETKAVLWGPHIFFFLESITVKSQTGQRNNPIKVALEGWLPSNAVLCQTTACVQVSSARSLWASTFFFWSKRAMDIERGR